MNRYPWAVKRFSPHTWRCFLIVRQERQTFAVFSTYVEVFPFLFAMTHKRSCFLHIRGGVSVMERWCSYVLLFSPHTWRCFSDSCGDTRPALVFSTYVEVFLQNEQKISVFPSFLHIRGGVSGVKTKYGY